MPKNHHLLPNLHRSDEEVEAAAQADEIALEWLYSLPLSSARESCVPVGSVEDIPKQIKK